MKNDNSKILKCFVAGCIIGVIESVINKMITKKITEIIYREEWLLRHEPKKRSSNLELLFLSVFTLWKHLHKY